MSAISTIGRAALLFAVLIPGCASSDDAQSEDDIQRGKASRSYLAVGMVEFRSGAFGTGALIRPNVVLTAGHVAIGTVDRYYYGSPPAGQASTSSKYLPSVKIVAAALGDCYGHVAFNGFPAHTRPATCPGDLDVGMVKLEKAIPDVTPLRMYDGGFEWLEGAMKAKPEAIAVGFGCHTLSDGKTNVKAERRYATSLFDSLTPAYVVVKAGTGIASGGDSGGPLLYNGFIIGTVRGPADPIPTNANVCARTREEYVRIDKTRDWINKQLKAWDAL